MSETDTTTETEENLETEDLENPLLAITTPDGSSELKDYLVNFTGEKLDEESVTVHMIAEVIAAEFPEFLFAFAEENFVRGYQIGLEDASKLFEGKPEEAIANSE
tara:strand:+ start:264 stop:578 length:315 start_codon:yes stop_codon:yes gene_type:complete